MTREQPFKKFRLSSIFVSKEKIWEEQFRIPYVFHGVRVEPLPFLVPLLLQQTAG